jgi:hypothetical protein
MMKLPEFLRHGAALCVMAVAAGACADGGTGPARPASLAAVTPVEQTVVVASPAPVPPAVRVSDERGRGLPGVQVAFAVTQGTGTVSASALTDADGVAVAADWVMGTEAQENVLTASVPGLAPVVFRATAGPGEAVAMQREGPALRSTQAGTVQGDSILVRVVDRHGNGVPGVEVSFSTSHGTLSRGRVTTGAQGWAGVYLPLSTKPGTIRVQASAQGFEPIQYDVRVTPGPPVRLFGGTEDTLQGGRVDGRVGKPFLISSTPERFIVVDAFGNGVPGYPVTFTPQPGHGVVVGGGAVLTDSLGFANVEWAPGQPGVNRMEITAQGLNSRWYAMSAKAACGSMPYTLFTTTHDAVNFRTACPSNDGEEYSLVVPAAQCVEFQMRLGYRVSGGMALLDLSNKLVAGASHRTVGGWGTADGTDYLIRIRLPAGTYRLSARARQVWFEVYWSFSEYAAWTISSRPVPPEEDAQCAFRSS